MTETPHNGQGEEHLFPARSAFRIAHHIAQGPRENIEDSVLAATVQSVIPSRNEACVLCVLDGVGGEKHGEIASRLAGQEILGHVLRRLGQSADAPPDRNRLLGYLIEAFKHAQQALIREITIHPELKGMATTAVCALATPTWLGVAWMGDSRCYLVRDQKLIRLTRDHNEAQELILTGLMTEEETKGFPFGHIINRFLPKMPFTEPETRIEALKPGDRVLLCTDGLTDVLTDQQIARIVQAASDTQSLDLLPQILVDHALTQGTQDNTSVLCCQYQPTAIQAPAEPDKTQTGEYPARRAEALRKTFQEVSHECETVVV